MIYLQKIDARKISGSSSRDLPIDETLIECVVYSPDVAGQRRFQPRLRAQKIERMSAFETISRTIVDDFLRQAFMFAEIRFGLRGQILIAFSKSPGDLEFLPHTGVHSGKFQAPDLETFAAALHVPPCFNQIWRQMDYSFAPSIWLPADES